MTECKREGCSQPAKKVYCSISCAAKVNNKLFVKRQKIVPVTITVLTVIKSMNDVAIR